jgi:Flp pilus assembly protein TadG
MFLMSHLTFTKNVNGLDIPMNNPVQRRPLRNAEKGQSLVEMAVGMVVLIMLLSGLLDLGRLYYIYVALEDAAGEAVLYLSIDPYCRDEDDKRGPTPSDISTDERCECVNPNNARYRAEHAPGADIIDWSRIDAEERFKTIVPGRYTDDGDFEPLVTPGGEVTVELSYPVALLTPIVPQFTGLNPIILRSSASQTIIRYWKSEPDMACAN